MNFLSPDSTSSVLRRLASYIEADQASRGDTVRILNRVLGSIRISVSYKVCIWDEISNGWQNMQTIEADGDSPDEIAQNLDVKLREQEGLGEEQEAWSFSSAKAVHDLSAVDPGEMTGKEKGAFPEGLTGPGILAEFRSSQGHLGLILAEVFETNQDGYDIDPQSAKSDQLKEQEASGLPDSGGGPASPLEEASYSDNTMDATDPVSSFL